MFFSPLGRHAKGMGEIVGCARISVSRIGIGLEDELCHRAQPIRRNHVRSSEPKGRALRITGVRSQGRVRKAANRKAIEFGGAGSGLAEVASLLGKRGDASRARCSRNLFVPLLGEEEEGFVLLDRTADGVAKVVAAKLVLHAGCSSRKAARLHEGIEGVERVVAAEVVNVAVEVVAAVLGDNADLPASGLPELSAVAIALNLELVNGIDGRKYKDSAVRTDVVVMSAVHEPKVGVHRAAADGKVRAALQAFTLGAETFTRGNARNRKHQLHEVAAIEREFRDLLTINKTRELAVGGFHLNRGSFHSDLLADRAELQRDVENEAVGGVKKDARSF